MFGLIFSSASLAGFFYLGRSLSMYIQCDLHACWQITTSREICSQPLRNFVCLFRPFRTPCMHECVNLQVSNREKKGNGYMVEV